MQYVNKAAQANADWADMRYNLPPVAENTKVYNVEAGDFNYAKVFKEGAGNHKVLDEAHNVVEYAKYKEVLKTTESANPLVESLRTTGELPSNYVTKVEAMAKGWKPGKTLNNYVPGGQIGRDSIGNTTGILPQVSGRVWYEADAGLINTMPRAKQAGTRLVYSNDGLMYITYDHYRTVHVIGTWR